MTEDDIAELDAQLQEAAMDLAKVRVRVAIRDMDFAAMHVNFVMDELKTINAKLQAMKNMR